MVSQNMTIKFDPINYFIQGLIDTIGLEEYKKLTHSFSEPKNRIIEKTEKRIEPIRRQMDQIYGVTSARGIAICSGRAAFRHLLRQQENELGFASDSFRLSPGKVKLKKGLTLLAKWIGVHFSENVELENGENCWLLKITPKDKNGSPEQTCGNLCDFKFGLLQGFLTWASGDKYFVVQEVACRCTGDEYCCYRIEKNPIE